MWHMLLVPVCDKHSYYSSRLIQDIHRIETEQHFTVKFLTNKKTLAISESFYGELAMGIFSIHRTMFNSVIVIGRDEFLKALS